MRYAIIGTGAIGGFYGGRLARAGFDVHFLLHSDFEYVRDNGLRVDSYDGSFVISHPQAYASVADMPPCDVVIVALKTTANGGLPAMLAPLLTERTLVLLIQNGVGVEADVEAALPGVQLAAGLAYICTTKVGPGHIEHTSNGKLSVANYSCRDQGLIDGLLADLGAAGIRASAVDYAKARWMKAMWNMPFNGPCSVLGQTTDRMLASPSGERLVRALLAEVIGAARACGAVGIDESVGERMIEMTRNMPPYSPSMKVDCDLGRPMEIEYLYTKPIAMAREAGYAMPHMEMVEMQLCAIEELRAVGPAVGL